MREGPLLRVAKAARPPPCTLPFPGQRSQDLVDEEHLFSLSISPHNKKNCDLKIAVFIEF